MVYLIFGQEAYKREIEVSRIAKGISVAKVEQFSQDCIDVLDGMSIMGKRIVVMKVDLLGADEVLLSYLTSNFPEYNDLIIVAHAVNQRTKLFDFLRKKGKILECQKLSRDKLVQYCLSAIKKLECQITSAAMDSLIDRSGYLIDDEVMLYKINIYLKQLSYRSSAIEVADVECVVPKHADEDARLLLTYLISGRQDKAMELAQELLSIQKQPIMIYGSIMRNLRIAYKTKMFPDLKEKELETLLGMNSYQMRSISNVRKLPEEVIINLLELARKGTNEIKGGLIPASEGLVRTIGEMMCVISND